MLARWADDDVFGQSLRNRHGSPEWVFYEGPPTANGRPGIHHVWARLFKDLYPRFHTMRGKHVVRKGGWDCHGLPVEVQVEKELGFSVKHEIEDYGIERFNAKCRSSVQRYVEDWQSLTNRIGMWLDTAGAYWTLSNDYIESVWWLLPRDVGQGRDLRGLQGRAVLRPRCGTALSSHELGQPGAYRDVTEPSVYVRFPLVDRRRRPPRMDHDAVDAAVERRRGGRPPRRLRARTRPRRRPRSRDWRATASRRCSAPTPRCRRRSRSTSWSARGYEPPFSLVAVEGAIAFRVVADEFVTVEDGSGIVHLAPAFGEIDREVGRARRPPHGQPGQRRRPASPTRGAPYAGKFVKDADPDARRRARRRGQACVKAVDYTHSYPHCWRCDTPLIYWAKPTWFARTSARTRRAAAREREDQLASRAHQARPLRRLARQQRRLGTFA